MNIHLTHNPKANILIVDDGIETLRYLCASLKQKGYEVRGVSNGMMALEEVEGQHPDLILLDIKLPDMDGYTVCQWLKGDQNTREIPIIFISAFDEVLKKVKAFKVGGVDYILKPFQFEELLARIENQLTLRWAKEKICQLNAKLEQKVAQSTAQLEAVNQELEHMGLHDLLMGLPNRVLFMERLEQAVKRIQEEPKYQYAVLFLDCDRFKVVNDSLGHRMGDQLLMAVACRLKSCLDPSNTLARFGGDEFMILMDNIAKIDDATSLAENIQEQFNIPFRLKERQVFITISIGIVLGTEDYQESDGILRDADIAMHRAKSKGKANYQVFDGQMHHLASQRLQLETDLRLARIRKELEVHYQPLICLATGRISGFEALMRWHHGEKGAVSPADFIPIAEETGTIVEIGQWILEQACQQLHSWQEEIIAAIDRDPPHLIISVNLSPKQFSQPNLMDQITRILNRNNLQGNCLKLEITESAIMDNAEMARSIVQQLKARKIKLSIDDFGTGYSSLSYLHRFPVDTLKIDRSFVSRIGDNGENLEIVQAIVTLAHNLHMTVTAEGIETAKQLEQLQTLGCEEGQGYFFSQPVPGEVATELLKQDLNRVGY